MSKGLKKVSQEFGKEPALLRFPYGILGFENVKEYILQKQGKSLVWELCPVEGNYPKFLLFAAKSVVTDYGPELPKDAMSCLQAKGREDLSYFAIAVVSEDIKRTTVNLRSPVVVNFRTNLAAQVILENEEYPMRHPIFSSDGRVN